MAKDKILESDLRRIERYIVKLRKNLKRADLDYTVQASVNSTKPKWVSYAATVTPPASGLAPITFISHVSANDLIEQIKVAIDKIDYEAVELAYHEAQIQACEYTIEGHRERIEAIKNPPKEEESEEVGEQSNESGEEKPDDEQQSK